MEKNRASFKRSPKPSSPKASFAGLGLAILAGCAPISEESCRAGNWYDLGVIDGTRGQYSDRVGSYMEECAEYGVRVDRNAWLRGRKEGLKEYCTENNAERIGQLGSRLRPVCANHKELITANRRGLIYHELSEEISNLRRERRHIHHYFRTRDESLEKKDVRREKRRHEARLREVETRLRLLRLKMLMLGL